MKTYIEKKDILDAYKQVLINEALEKQNIDEGLLDRIKAKAAGITSVAKDVAQNVSTVGKNIKSIAGNIKADITGKGERESIKSLTKVSDIKQKAGSALYTKRILSFIDKVKAENQNVTRKLGVEVKKYPDVVRLFNKTNRLIEALDKIIK